MAIIFERQPVRYSFVAFDFKTSCLHMCEYYHYQALLTKINHEKKRQTFKKLFRNRGYT